jgi:hypothetical protein
MSSRVIGRSSPSQARLQLVLAALGAWNLLSFLLELTNSRLLDVDSVEGALGARAVGGSLAVLGLAYLYAVRNPIRHRFVLWLASVEQFVAIFSMTFHLARDEIAFSESAFPMIAAAVFLVLLMLNLPRQTDTMPV